MDDHFRLLRASVSLESTSDSSNGSHIVIALYSLRSLEVGWPLTVCAIGTWTCPCEVPGFPCEIAPWQHYQSSERAAGGLFPRHRPAHCLACSVPVFKGPQQNAGNEFESVFVFGNNNYTFLFVAPMGSGSRRVYTVSLQCGSPVYYSGQSVRVVWQHGFWYQHSPESAVSLSRFIFC